jgi:hypothetical protein
MLNYKRKWFILLLPISIVILIIARTFEGFTERILSGIIYKNISQGISYITSLVPFSLMEVSLIMLPGVLVFLFIYLLVILIRGRQNKRDILNKAVVNLLSSFSILLFTYVILCGVNYERYTFADYSGLTIQDSSVEELESLFLTLAEQGNVARDQLKQVSASYEELAKESVRAMNNLSTKYPVLERNYRAPKLIISSDFMSKMQITGIYWPFTVEANINVAVTEYTLAATMCHELAHIAGFMREDEANYIAYLACKNSDSKELQYSGIMLALAYVGNQLYYENKEAYQNIRATYSEELVADLNRNAQYWEQYRNTKISELSDEMNNIYLKANNQSDGVKSYGRMVDLLLAEYRQ